MISPALMRWDGRSSPVRFLIRSPPDSFGWNRPWTALVLIRSPVYPFRGRPTLSPRVASIREPRDSPVLSAADSGGPDNFANFNHTLNVPNPILSDQFDIRIDHTINSKQNVFGRWTYKNGRTVNPSGLLLPAETDFEHDNQIVLAHNYAITPNLVNELRGGLSRGQLGGTFPSMDRPSCNSWG